MHVTLIHNPGAGDEGVPEAELRALLESAGHRVTYRSTKTRGWKKALEDPGDLAVAAGGDGTVAKVARQLAGRAIPMGILPWGTANNIARSLGLEAEAKVLIERWETARPIPLDLGVARGPWGERRFFESFGLGLLPTLMARSKELISKSGSPASEQVDRNVELMLELLDEAVPIECTITADGLDLSGGYLLVEIMNIRSIGPRVDLAPEADPGDGLLDVVTIRESELRAAADFLRASLAGESTGQSFVCGRAKAVQIRCSITPTHVDDELWPDPDESSESVLEDDKQMAVDVLVDPAAVRVLL
jgi:diacylglycerol kinase family enzyme